MGTWCTKKEMCFCSSFLLERCRSFGFLPKLFSVRIFLAFEVVTDPYGLHFHCNVLSPAVLRRYVFIKFRFYCTSVRWNCHQLSNGKTAEHGVTSPRLWCRLASREGWSVCSLPSKLSFPGSESLGSSLTTSVTCPAHCLWFAQEGKAFLKHCVHQQSANSCQLVTSGSFELRLCAWGRLT